MGQRYSSNKIKPLQKTKKKIKYEIDKYTQIIIEQTKHKKAILNICNDDSIDIKHFVLFILLKIGKKNIYKRCY